MDLDTAAKAALEAQAIDPVWYCWLDVLGDPLRGTTGVGETIAGSGDAELDGDYEGFDPRFVEIGEVATQEGGSETVTCKLSGILEMDSDLMNTLADPANWRGRTARLWVQIRDEDGTPQGAIAPFYTGYMTSLSIEPSAEGQTIVLRIENYLALLSRASNRNYLSQARYDPADTSARATIGAANGTKAPGQAAGTGGILQVAKSLGLVERVTER